MYVYFGKKISNNLKITSLNLAYKLSKLLSSHHNVKIITSGGVYKNKKLQIGSIIPLCKNNHSNMKNSNKKLVDYCNISLIRDILNPYYSDNMGNKIMSNFMQNSLFSYKPRMEIPHINS